MYDYRVCTERDILCIDLKSFFASVSCIEKGLDPMTTKLAVVGDTKRPGSVVLASTPPLKKLGIKTGSRLYEIPQRNDIFIINPSMKKYISISTQISKIALNFVAPEDFWQYSIDEHFLDITNSYQLFCETPYEFARLIQNKIYEQTQIFSTIGIGSNMLLAKLSMDLEAKKTNEGIAEWRYKDIPGKLWHIEPLTKMWGINKRTEAKPIIDIMVVVKNIEKVDEFNKKLNDLGYENLGENGIPRRRFFRKGKTKRTHHLHVFDYKNKTEIERHLAFKEYLKSHKEIAKEYGELKNKLAKNYPEDIKSYVNGKDKYVKKIEKRAIDWYRQ